jgi:hypothetical protein
MNLETGRLVHHIATAYTEGIHELVDEAMLDFIDSDWEDDFDDIYEAYEETGRGQAELVAIAEAIRKGRADLDLTDDMSVDEYSYLYDALAAEWNLTTN